MQSPFTHTCSMRDIQWKPQGIGIKEAKDRECVFALGQQTHRTCCTGGCGCRVREGLEELKGYRQVHEWIQKCLGKAIPSNIPNKNKSGRGLAGGRLQKMAGSSVHPKQRLQPPSLETAWGEMNCSSDLFLIYLKINSKGIRTLVLEIKTWSWFDPTIVEMITAKGSLSQS